MLAALQVTVLECADARAAHAWAHRSPVDLVLADLDLGWGSPAGRGFAGWCATLPGDARVIALAGMGGRADPSRLPARCQILRADASPAELARLVARELSAEHPAMQLTERQRDVLALAAMGSRNDQIALELCITTGTVKRHLHDAFAALGASSRVEAVGRARSFGLI